MSESRKLLMTDTQAVLASQQELQVGWYDIREIEGRERKGPVILHAEKGVKRRWTSPRSLSQMSTISTIGDRAVLQSTLDISTVQKPAVNRAYIEWCLHRIGRLTAD
jgi:hypothetical protein